MLQSSPIKEISSRDYEVPKALGLSNWKENMSITLTYKKFTKPQGLVQELQSRSKEGYN